jgi:hypothetical protein
LIGPGASPSENVDLIRLPEAPEPPEAPDAPSVPMHPPAESVSEIKLPSVLKPVDRLAHDRWREDHDREKHDADLKGHKNDIENRGKYTKRLYWTMVGWMSAAYLVLLLTGWTVGGFTLSDSVLIALITGTTANVIGLFVIVARYLFTKR